MTADEITRAKELLWSSPRMPIKRTCVMCNDDEEVCGLLRTAVAEIEDLTRQRQQSTTAMHRLTTAVRSYLTDDRDCVELEVAYLSACREMPCPPAPVRRRVLS